MNKLLAITSGLAPLALTLAACSGAPSSGDAQARQHAAHFYLLDDVSGSSAMQDDDAVGNAARRRAGEAVRELALGDAITVLEVGGRAADRFVAHPTITTGPQLRQAKASRKLVSRLEDIARRYQASGGDSGTNLLLALENLHPDCASGRSMIMIVSDGIESSDAYDAAAALHAGKPVMLPKPSGRFLRGCKLAFLGFGVSVDPTLGKGVILPEVQLAALRTGWVHYLTAAGIAPDAVTFTSLL